MAVKLSVFDYPGWEADDHGYVYRNGQEIFGCENDGYIKVWDHNSKQSINRATLVCTAWYGPKPFKKAQVRHLNDVHIDDRPSNLAWGTQLENAADAIRNGISNEGQRNGNSKLTEWAVLDIRGLAGYFTRKEIAAIHYISISLVDKIINRDVWRHI
jgi:hypothetical protein